MDPQETLPLDPITPVRRAPKAPQIGRDELNLAEFPFALLSSKGMKNAPLTREFKVGERQWLIRGDPLYGLPTSPDAEVYVILMQLTYEQGFPDRVQFTRYELLERLGWDQHGESYKRLRLAFRRLYGIRISAINAFFNANHRRREREQAISIIADYDVVHGEDADPDDGGFPTWISWSPELHRNMRAKWIKPLDVRFYLSLRSGTAQRVYRYLDLRRGGDDKPVYQEELRDYAYERIGLSRTYSAPSQIKQKLAAAHRELIEKGFLSSVEYAPMKTEPGREQVIYRFAPRRSRSLVSREQLVLPERSEDRPPSRKGGSVAEEPPALIAALIDAGVSRRSAAELAQSAPEECRQQLEYLPYREGVRDPGAVLVKSIREGWSVPPAWLQAQEEQRKLARKQQRRAQAEAQAKKSEALEGEFDAFWNALSPRQREELELAAAAALRKENRVLAEFAGKHPNSPMYREALRPYLKQLSGWRTASK